MSVKLWARCESGVVAEIIALPAALVPGQDIFTPAIASALVDVTALNPQPIQGWVTPDGGKTFSAPVEPTLSVGDLLALAAQQQGALVNTDVSVNVGTATAPINVLADASPTGRTDLIGLIDAYTQGIKASGSTTSWYQSTGVLQLTQAQLVTIASAVTAHVNATYAAWQQAAAGISASPPTITKASQVRSVFASVMA